VPKPEAQTANRPGSQGHDLEIILFLHSQQRFVRRTHNGLRLECGRPLGDESKRVNWILAAFAAPTAPSYPQGNQNNAATQQNPDSRAKPCRWLMAWRVVLHGGIDVNCAIPARHCRPGYRDAAQQ
jgi:hypothetical protein